MIKIKHSPEDEVNPFGSLRVEMGNPLGIRDLDVPINFRVLSSVSGKPQWEDNLTPGCWSYYGMISNTISQVTRKEEVLCEFVWDTFLHGDLAHQHMMIWAIENKGFFGITVGTHNGETGEWVEPVRKGLINGILVEASTEQFLELTVNYKDVKNCKVLNCLVTPEGGEFTFWESKDESYANSVLKEHVEKFPGEMSSKIMESISLNDLISSQDKEVKWLHLDVEGIDTDLILSLSQENIKSLDFIIYESLNTKEERKEECKVFLEERGFFVRESGWNTLAIRN